MEHKDPGPRWWQLYVLCALIPSMLYLESRLDIGPTAHTLAQVVILAVDFGMIFRWIHVNSGALARQGPIPDWPPLELPTDKPPAHPPEVSKPTVPHLQFPPTGVIHVLETTFQRDWLADEVQDDSSSKKDQDEG
jgi:hypothetical protein